MATGYGLPRQKENEYDSSNNFVSELLPLLGWGKSEEKEVLLDVGCGTGFATFQLILPVFPLGAKIFAIDIQANKIEYAKQRNYHPLIHYKVANFEDWSAVKQWEGQISKITSLNCIQWLRDPQQVFQQMFKLLKNNGEIAVRFSLASPMYDSVWQLTDHPRWNQFFKRPDNFNPDIHARKFVPYHYKIMLEEMGFEIRYFREEETCQEFPTDGYYLDFLSTKFALMNYVPRHERNDFLDYLFHCAVILNDRDLFGRMLHRGIVFEVVAKKKV